MSWTIAAIREGLAVRLRTIDGLHVHSSAPGAIVPPAAVILLGDGQFLTYDTSSDSDDLGLVIRLYVAGAENIAGQVALDEYLNRNTDKSIYDAVAADPKLGGAVDDASVAGVSAYGISPVGTAELLYFGCEFVVDVLVS